MTPADLRRIREAAGFGHHGGQTAFARALGYEETNSYRRYESGGRPVPMLLARLMTMIERHGVPQDWREDRTSRSGGG